MTMCEHMIEADDPAARTPQGCEDCLKTGSRWVHLRRCLECGHIGCCDSSPNRHATAHFNDTGHPVIRSYEPGEEWRWCFVHQSVA
ncbi:UBP-type zinc finger domain-containing protein [Spongiactinospora sp. TRM90649]|uniref:ubiquitin carboxyl-terminal hydrolase 14 n=1 Tax=Spongiactinospora sp. TRM90649 TaxID=3031114 RepID=UPI0023F93E2F|nr:UBP-type zinc finger domain-containing protein [Spongiactinospora sp. TRM90649]MDF5752372.1 UBP-type zinc finger domain-containing protein [Spongiactinospora sp. TRM90649]